MGGDHTVESGDERTLPATTQQIPAALASWPKNRAERGFAGQSPEEIDGFWGNPRRAPAQSPYSEAVPTAQPALDGRGSLETARPVRVRWPAPARSDITRQGYRRGA